MRRLLALLTASLLGGAVLIVGGAAPAQAACPYVEYLHVTYQEAQWWAKSSTRVVDCGSYYRLTSHLFAASTNVRKLYRSDNYGRPSVYWWNGDGGQGFDPVNGIDAYETWTPGMFTTLNNAICYKPCGVEFDGTADIAVLPDVTFHKWGFFSI